VGLLFWRQGPHRSWREWRNSARDTVSLETSCCWGCPSYCEVKLCYESGRLERVLPRILAIVPTSPLSGSVGSRGPEPHAVPGWAIPQIRNSDAYQHAPNRGVLPWGSDRTTVENMNPEYKLYVCLDDITALVTWALLSTRPSKSNDGNCEPKEKPRTDPRWLQHIAERNAVGDVNKETILGPIAGDR